MSLSIELLRKRRATLFEQINRLYEEDDSLTLDLIEKLDKAELEAIGFRWHSDSTKLAEDRTLRNYLLFVSLLKSIPRDAPKD